LVKLNEEEFASLSTYCVLIWTSESNKREEKEFVIKQKLEINSNAFIYIPIANELICASYFIQIFTSSSSSFLFEKRQETNFLF
jgi:hypothetical protein